MAVVGVGKEAARSRNRWYIAWSAHHHRSALALQTAPSVANDQCRDQQQRSRLRLMTPFLLTPRVQCGVACQSRGMVSAELGEAPFALLQQCQEFRGLTWRNDKRYNDSRGLSTRRAEKLRG